LDYRDIRAKVHRMIIMHAGPRQTDRLPNIMAIARRFVLMNASRAKTAEVGGVVTLAVRCQQ